MQNAQLIPPHGGALVDRTLRGSLRAAAREKAPSLPCIPLSRMNLADLGGGVVRTLCHPLDYLRYLLGEAEVAWAETAHLSDLELQGVEDTAEIALHFAGGARGSVHLNYHQRPPAHWLEVLGSEGTIRWDYATGEARLWQAASADWEVVGLPPGWERNAMFLEEMRHFLAVARGEATPICTLEDGVRALELVLKALSPSQ